MPAPGPDAEAKLVGIEKVFGAYGFEGFQAWFPALPDGVLRQACFHLGLELFRSSQPGEEMVEEAGGIFVLAIGLEQPFQLQSSIQTLK